MIENYSMRIFQIKMNSSALLLQELENSGLRINDPRLKESMHYLCNLQRHWDYCQYPSGPFLTRHTFKEYASM